MRSEISASRAVTSSSSFDAGREDGGDEDEDKDGGEDEGEGETDSDGDGDCCSCDESG